MASIDRLGSLLRWGLIAALTYLVLFDGGPPAPAELAFVAVLFASTVAFPRLVSLVPHASPAAVALVLDTGFVLAGLWICDAASRDLLVAYFVAILLASLGDSEKRIAGIAFLVTAAYALWAVPTESLQAATPLLLRLPFLLLTTLFYGTMMQRLRTERGRRLEAEERIRELDFLVRVTQLLGSSTATRDVLARSATIVRESLGTDRCELVPAGAESPDPLAAEAMEQRRMVRRETGDGPALAVPILHELEPLGALVVDFAGRGSGPGDAEVRLLQIIANAAAPALRNVRDFEQVLDRERARSETLIELSQRFRVLATSILAHAELVKHETEPEAEMHRELVHHLDEIVRRADEIYEGSADVPSSAGLSFGDDARRDAPLEVHLLLEEAIRAARHLAGGPDVDVTVRLEADLPAVRSDAERIRQVLASLLVRTFRSAGWGPVSIEGNLCSVAGGARQRPLLRLQVSDARGPAAAPDAPGADLSLLVSGWVADLLGIAVRVDPRSGLGARRYEVLIPVG